MTGSLRSPAHLDNKLRQLIFDFNNFTSVEISGSHISELDASRNSWFGASPYLGMGAFLDFPSLQSLSLHFDAFTVRFQLNCVILLFTTCRAGI